MQIVAFVSDFYGSAFLTHIKGFIGFLKTSVLVLFEYAVGCSGYNFRPLLSAAGGMLIQDYPFAFCFPHLPLRCWIHLALTGISLSILHLFCVILSFFAFPWIPWLCYYRSITCLLRASFNIILSFSFNLFPYQTPVVYLVLLSLFSKEFFFVFDVACVEFGTQFSDLFCQFILANWQYHLSCLMWKYHIIHICYM